jgi:hypothetical protein
MSSDEYTELLENTRIALKQLIHASEPGHYHVDAWNLAYRAIRQALDHESPHREPDVDPFADERHRWGWWLSNEPEQRERHVLNVLGDQRMSITEIAEAIEAEDPENRFLCYSKMVPTIKRMVDAGDLVRERIEQGSRLVYVYFRPPMTPELEDLQRRLDA